VRPFTTSLVVKTCHPSFARSLEIQLAHSFVASSSFAMCSPSRFSCFTAVSPLIYLSVPVRPHQRSQFIFHKPHNLLPSIIHTTCTTYHFHMCHHENFFSSCSGFAASYPIPRVFYFSYGSRVSVVLVALRLRAWIVEI